MTRILFVLLVFLVSLPSQALAFDHGYALWNRDLAKFNSRGSIHYAEWQRDHGRLDRFLAEMRAVSVQQIGGWSEAEREAFWINAYNALVVADIIKVYPALNKMKDWTYNIAGQTVGTADIRDRILRGSETKVPMLSNILRADTTIAKGRDRRILFALCDGTRATPLLASKAYTPRHLSEQLDAQVRRTVAEPAFVRVDPRLKIFHVGNFFRVYQKDFQTFPGNSMMFAKSDSGNRGLLRFLFPYLQKSVQDKVLARHNVAWQVDYRLSSHDLNGGD